MKQTNKISTNILIYLMITVLMAFSVSAATATFVDLGESKHFAVLSKAAITDTVPTGTAITGEMGISPAAGTFISGIACSEVTGFDPLNEIHMPSGSAGDASCEIVDPVYMTTVVSNMETAYTAAQAQPNGVGTFLNRDGGTLAALTLNPGVYTWGSNVLVTDDLTLDCLGDANAVYVFQILSGGKLELSAGKKVILAGDCQAGNVFWAVEGLTNLLAGSHLEGTVLGSPGVSEISLVTGSTVTGRLLGEKTIALDQNTITKPTLLAEIPSVTLNTPANNTFTTNNQSNHSFTFVDDVSANVSCSLFINGTSYGNTTASNNTATLIAPNATLAEGVYNWTVNCTDSSNNVGTATQRIITIDKTAPSMSSFTLSASSVSVGGTITGSCSATDNLDPNVGTSITGIDTTTAGDKTATCTATDAAGNSVSTTAAYSVTAVAVTSGSSGGGGGGGGSSVSQWTCSEWSVCSSDGVQIKTCTTTNGGTSSEERSCTPVQTTAPTPPQETVPTQPEATDSDSTGTAGQDTTVILTSPSPITGQVVGPSGKLPSWLTSWWAIALMVAAVIGLVAGGLLYSNSNFKDKKTGSKAAKKLL